MKGHFYADIQTIKTAVTEQLRSIPESAFRSFRNAGNGVSMQGETILKGTNSNNV
jgi:hypothetical protein